MEYVYIAAALFALIMWVLAIVFLILIIVVRKRKIGRWVFTTLTVICGVLPFIVYWQLDHNDESRERSFAGVYANQETNNYLVLNANKTWFADSALFDCNGGKWDYIFNDGMEYLNLTGVCDSGRISEDIRNFSFEYVEVTTGNEINSERTVGLYRKN